MRKLLLMNRTHEVCVVEYDTDYHRIAGIVELREGADRGPLGVLTSESTSYGPGSVSEGEDTGRGPLDVPASEDTIRRRLIEWWGSRRIPDSRPGIEKNLKALSLSSTRELTEYNHGLSLSDQYWMKDCDDETRWQDINFFNNPFDDRVGKLLFGGMTNASESRGNILQTQEYDLHVPDNTSDGNLPKRWAILGGIRSLIKGGSFLEQEPYNEIIACDLYSRLLDSHEFVPYRLFEDSGAICSLCPNMLSDEEEYVPALYVDRLLPYREGEGSYEHYIRCCEHLGIADAEVCLSKMLACDYLLANFDRHYRNFGIIRNVESLECRMAPLFDSGSSLWCNKRTLSEGSLAYTSLPFVGDPLLQVKLVRDYSWFLPEKLRSFSASMITTLSEGPLRAYGMRLITIEDAIDERIDMLVDSANSLGL